MIYHYLLCDSTNVVNAALSAECGSHDEARLLAATMLRQGVCAIEVWQDARPVSRVEGTPPGDPSDLNVNVKEPAR